MAHVLVVADEGPERGWIARCSCGWQSVAETEAPEELGPDLDEALADFAALKHRAQAFFADLSAESRRPSFGHMAMDWTNALLNRATEAGLYRPDP